MSADVRRMLAMVGVFVALGLAAAVLLPRVLGLAAGPQVDIITELANTERQSLELDVLGEKLVSSKHHFDRVTVNVDAQAGTAVATATLDFDGKYGETKVSSLGVERVPFQADGSGWKPRDGWAPRLSAIVAALEQRRRALSGSDLSQLTRLTGGAPVDDPDVRRIVAMPGHTYTARAWYIRSEREEITVTEDYRLVGTTPDRPIDEEGSRRLILSPDSSGREFFFPKGLM